MSMIGGFLGVIICITGDMMSSTAIRIL